MPSDKEQFFQLHSFAVIGNSSTKKFPVITYRNLRRMGKKVYPVDLGGRSSIEGDRAYGSLAALPEPVDGAIVEVKKADTLDAVKAVAAAGIKEVWLHQLSDTPEALAFCREQGAHVRHGSCAVMYTNDRLSYHTVHQKLARLLGKY